jgi:hypothetical protein
LPVAGRQEAKHRPRYETYDAASLRGGGYARIQPSHRREPGWPVLVALLVAPHIHPVDSVSPA